MSTKRTLIWVGSVLGAVILVVLLGIVLGRLGVGGGKPDADQAEDWENLDEKAATAERSKERPLKVMVIAEFRTSAFGKGLYLGALKAQQELDRIFVSFGGPVTREKADEQNHVFRSKLDEGMDAIVVDPANPKTLPPHIKVATDRRVPTVVVDVPAPGGTQVAFVANDYEAAGALGAERLAAEVGDKGKVALLRHQKEVACTTAIEKGFLDAMKTKHAGVQIVSQDQYAGLDEKTAPNVVKELLSKAKPDGIFCSGETGAVAVLKALQAAKLAGKTKLVACDANPVLIKALKEGQVHGLALGNAAQIGYLGVKAVVGHIRDEQIESEAKVEPVMVTKQNMDSPEMKDIHSPDPAALRKQIVGDVEE